MKMRQFIALVVFAFAIAVGAQTPEDEVLDRGWPRAFETQEYEILVHQPQVDEWPNFERITFRAAISIKKKGQSESTYGAIRVSGATKISKTDRLVMIYDRKIEHATFPDANDADAKRLTAAVMAVSPSDKAITVSLDRIIPQLDAKQVSIRQVEVNLAPPKIIASDKPAIMVIFAGKPRFKPVAGSGIMFAINTNWDIFLDTSSSKYYLLNGKSWLTTDNIEKGTWAAATILPAALTNLPADDNWKDVRDAIPLVPAANVPIIFVSNEPAELIMTDGAPQFQPIPRSKLMLVANTESNLLFNTGEKQYYLLTAGRWFKAVELAGPWTAASTSLPDDFKKIPQDSDAADMLASVPGTDEAKDAMIMASIPQKATIDRKGVTVNVTYNGTPKFIPIETTAVQYACNTPFDVFLVDSKYYCCYNAVWFTSSRSVGPWAVCDSVPAAIYTIPPTSPKYNVTYVVVYESTPTTVVVGYTAGYYGETIASNGALVYGLGMAVEDSNHYDYDDDDYYYYPPYYYSYGCGSYYYYGYGGYVTHGWWYGPYGGAGRYGVYNPITGVYSRGAAVYGPNGAAGYRAAYNPSTGNAGYRAGGGNAYSSWGRAGVTNGEDWVRGGYRTGPNGSVRAIQGSGGAGAVRVDGKYGNGTTVVRNQDGDIYAGKDGNVYKRTDDGWQQQSRANTASATQGTMQGQRAANRQSTQQAYSRPSPATTRQVPAQAGNLQKEAAYRDRGERSVARTQQYQRSGSQYTPRSGGGSRGGGARGGGRR
jgi:hypothetical protein